ncbi:MAG: flavohemoglobin expression-modulating QEGLA motif protein, partial [Gammaproteobacteria bacterium]|nr:flavohemoglobin expression-modulating QEGLA motif protein [Gammaproteobacteria bacterium]
MKANELDSILKKLEASFESNEAFHLSNDLYDIHIDRQLPFLVVYRYPKTCFSRPNELFQVFSSYIECPADDRYRKNNQALINKLLELQIKRFGNSLLLQVWTTPFYASLSEEDDPSPPKFTLVAPTVNAPVQTLTALEHALQDIEVRKRKAIVGVIYTNSISPPDLEPINISEDLVSNTTQLGLEVREIYRSPDDNLLYPYALKNLQHGVELAVKKGIYAYTQERTVCNLAHYHILGKQALNEWVWQCDKALAQINEQFDILLYVTPVNASQAWQQFSENNFRVEPEFHYRPRKVDPTLLKRQLYQIPLERIEDPALNSLFLSKRDELDEQIGLLNKRETSKFLYGCVQMFGTVDKELLQAAHFLLAHNPKLPHSGDDLVEAEDFEILAREEMAIYREQDATLASTVSLQQDITGILVSRGNFLIGKDAKVSKNRLRATLAHEIGTHVLTYHNGKNQPFQQLYAGMAGYEELQEGLAVFSEYLCGGLGYDRLQVLAGRVIAVDSITQGASFVETFNLLSEKYGFYPHTAFYITMRVYRGGGYTKDIIYLRGLLSVIELIAKGVDIELLYVGKLAFEHIDIIEELVWRNIIQKPRLMPKILKDPVAQNRITAIKREP